jgi:protein CMS1
MEKERKAKVCSISRPLYICLVSTCQNVDVYLQKRKLGETSNVVEPVSITAQSPVALQEYLASKQAKTFSTMSTLELGDMRIPGRLAGSFTHGLHSQDIQVEGSIADTTIWTGPRTLDQLVDFIVKGKSLV